MQLAIRKPLWRDVSDNDWNDWHWQMANRITCLDDLQEVVALDHECQDGIRRGLQKLRMAITPYYAALMHYNDPHCPIRRQAIPTAMELRISNSEMPDPLHEGRDSPVPGITHRYPDRALLLVTDQCAMYCRHCTRRRFAGQKDQALSVRKVKRAIQYIREHSQIRDVLISGGDPLCLPDNHLEFIFSSLRAIPHVEIIRVGTRTPVVMPMRITDALCEMMRKYHPLWINTHFNHPAEITIKAAEACQKLADAGIPLGNQSVLLKGVNDCPYIQRDLVQKLVKNRVRPYYLYQCDLSEGIEHFRTPVSRGVEIIECLRGHTSGLAIPTFVVDAPGGGGKIPVNPQYVISQSPEKIILRNFEGVLCSYDEPQDGSHECQDCGICSQYDESAYHGIEKLYRDELRCLIPRSNERINRRQTSNDMQ